MKLHIYIKRKRQEIGMTQTSLAKILDVNPPVISRYESGGVVPSGKVLWKFLLAFKLVKK